MASRWSATHEPGTTSTSVPFSNLMVDGPSDMSGDVRIIVEGRPGTVLMVP